MSDFARNIEELLKEHDFVTIPGFGGFVAEESAATETNGVLFPPCKQLAFNPALTYNDGLLAHEYVRKMGISYEKANLLIAESVNNLNRKLIGGKPVPFGSIGYFSINNGNILFEMAGKGGFLASSFGLEEVYFPLLSDTEKSKESATELSEEPKHEAVRISIDTKTNEAPNNNNDEAAEHIKTEGGFSKALGMAAAILLLIMLFPVKVQDGNFSNYASMVPAILEKSANESKQGNQCEAYHMIIASFNTKFGAEKFVGELPPDFKNRSTIIYSDKRFRVAIESFYTEEEAEDYVYNFVRDFPQYYDAWVLNYTIP